MDTVDIQGPIVSLRPRVSIGNSHSLARRHAPARSLARAVDRHCVRGKRPARERLRVGASMQNAGRRFRQELESRMAHSLEAFAAILGGAAVPDAPASNYSQAARMRSGNVGFLYAAATFTGNRTLVRWCGALAGGPRGCRCCTTAQRARSQHGHASKDAASGSRCRVVLGGPGSSSPDTQPARVLLF